jgi:hypothetical protein
MIARSFRYYVEGVLAVFYGKRVMVFLKDNGLTILIIAAAAAAVAFLVYAIVNRRRSYAKDL